MKQHRIIGISLLSVCLLLLGGCNPMTSKTQQTKTTKQSTGKSDHATSKGDQSKNDNSGGNGSAQQSGSDQSNQSSGQNNTTGDNNQSGQSDSSNQSDNNSSQTTSTTNTSGNSNATNNEQSSPAPKTKGEALNNVANALNTRVPLMLPTNVSVSEGKYLTAITHSETWYYRAQFYQVNSPTKINAETLLNSTPIATVEGTEYKNAADAKNAIDGYIQVNTSQANTVNLGHGIKGVEEGATGHMFITWNEGRWSLKIDSATDPSYRSQEYKNSKKVAEDVVSYLNDYMLPAPQDIGVITINTWKNSNKTTIQWQYHEMTYQVTSHNPFIALKMAVAMKFK